MPREREGALKNPLSFRGSRSESPESIPSDLAVDRDGRRRSSSNQDPWLWIPGSTLARRPGMTTERRMTDRPISEPEISRDMGPRVRDDDIGGCRVGKGALRRAHHRLL